MSIMEAEILSEPLVLPHCYEANADAMERLVAAINRKGIRHLRIAARGSSNNACVYFKYLCEVLTGLTVSFVYPSVVTVYGGQLRGEDTMLLAVSQGGQGKDLLLLLQNAKANGVFTVSMTNDPASPLARQADMTLSMELPTEESMAATKSFSAELLLLSMLALRLGGRSMAPLGKLGAVLSDIPGLSEEFDAFAQSLMGIDNLFVMSRGFGLALAKEACCKLQETCLVNATPYAVSDFLHGPFALVDENTRVLLLVPSDGCLQSNLDMLQRLREQKAGVMLLSSEEEVIRRFGGLKLPKAEPELEVFLFAMAIQLICSKLADRKGLNPDTSRNLNKYTVTI